MAKNITKNVDFEEYSDESNIEEFKKSLITPEDNGYKFRKTFNKTKSDAFRS